MDTGCSSGWMRRNSRRVRLSPYLIPKLETISDTASPAPWRRACMRMNQLPIPASGASSARFGRRATPSPNGSVREDISNALLHDVEGRLDEAVVGDQSLVVDRVRVRVERRLQAPEPVRLDSELA